MPMSVFIMVLIFLLVVVLLDSYLQPTSLYTVAAGFVEGGGAFLKKETLVDFLDLLFIYT